MFLLVSLYAIRSCLRHNEGFDLIDVKINCILYLIRCEEWYQVFMNSIGR